MYRCRSFVKYCFLLDLGSSLHRLGGKQLCDIGLGDDNVDQAAAFEDWCNQLLASLCNHYSIVTQKEAAAVEASSSPPKKEWLSQKEYRRQKKETEPEVEMTEEDILNDEYLMEGESDSEDEGKEEKKDADDGLVDVEEIGPSMIEAAKSAASKEMITPMQRKALTKEGYKLIGTHSAVKICRWTKHQLRGRGGCYKHSFYGITSYLCMETTPSLACANKCVFCWRVRITISLFFNIK